MLSASISIGVVHPHWSHPSALSHAFSKLPDLVFRMCAGVVWVGMELINILINDVELRFCCQSQVKLLVKAKFARRLGAAGVLACFAFGSRGWLQGKTVDRRRDQRWSDKSCPIQQSPESRHGPSRLLPLWQKVRRLRSLMVSGLKRGLIRKWGQMNASNWPTN